MMNSNNAEVQQQYRTWVDNLEKAVKEQNQEDVKRQLVKLTYGDVSINLLKLEIIDKGFYLIPKNHSLLGEQINNEDIADILVRIRCPLYLLVGSWMNLGIFESMIEKGADLNEKDANGRSALSLALEKRLDEMAIVLLRSDADVNSEELHVFDPIVIYDTSLRLLKLLVTKKVDINSVDQSGNTLLYVVMSLRDETYKNHSANYNETEDIIFILLERGARFHVNSKCAVADKHWSPDRRLSDAIDHLIDCEMTPDERCTFARRAIQWGWLTLVKSFLKRGFDINERNEYGYTPLHSWASSLCESADKLSTRHNNDIENVVRLIFCYGADVTSECNVSYERGTVFDMARRSIIGTYDIVPEEELDKMINPVVEEIARLDYHGIPVNEFDLLEIKEIDRLSGYYKDCVKELELMRSRMFYKKISLYDVLNGVNTQRLGHLQNTHSIERFNLDEYRNEFPIYSKMLTYKSNEILLSQRLTRQASVILNSIFSSVIPIEVIIHNVIVYLNFNEMKIITKGYEGDYDIRFD